MALLAAVFTCSMSSIFFKYMTAPSSAAAAYRLGFTVLLLTPWGEKDAEGAFFAEGQGRGPLLSFGRVFGVPFLFLV